MVAGKVAKLKHGDNQHTKVGGPIGPSNEEAAKKLNASPRSVGPRNDLLYRTIDRQ